MCSYVDMLIYSCVSSEARRRPNRRRRPNGQGGPPKRNVAVGREQTGTDFGDSYRNKDEEDEIHRKSRKSRIRGLRWANCRWGNLRYQYMSTRSALGVVEVPLLMSPSPTASSRPQPTSTSRLFLFFSSSLLRFFFFSLLSLFLFFLFCITSFSSSLSLSAGL